jgi:hypothetical protein
MLTRITDTDFGTYRMRTASGTTYRLNLRPEGSTLTRLPIRDSPDEEYDQSVLRKDGEPLPLLGIVRAAVGASAAFWVDVRRDGIRTFRLTTPVMAIEREEESS